MLKDAQKYLNDKYPKSRKEATKTLSLNAKNLKGTLKLEGFGKLEEVYCQNNQLTKLCINSCPKLVRICCLDNPLTEIIFEDNEVFS